MHVGFYKSCFQLDEQFFCTLHLSDFHPEINILWCLFVLGKTTVGHGAMDISIQGPGVAAQHCFIENRAGIITLHPCGNQCSMDGLPVNKPVRLSQGTRPVLFLCHYTSWSAPKIKCEIKVAKWSFLLYCGVYQS